MDKAVLKPNEYQCENCGGVFQKGWSDEECLQEGLNNFGGLVADDPALFCDDCYKEFMRWLATKQ